MKVCSLNVQNHHRGQNTPHNETNVYKQSKYDQNCNKTSWIVQSRAWDGAVDHHDPLQLYVHESVKRLERSTAAGSTAEPEQVLSDLTKPREIKKGLLHHQNICPNWNSNKNLTSNMPFALRTSYVCEELDPLLKRPASRVQLRGTRSSQILNHTEKWAKQPLETSKHERPCHLKPLKPWNNY